MKKIIIVIAAALMIGAGFTSCRQANPVSSLYSRSTVLADQPAKWASQQPVLSTAADSAAYLMGYVYGGNMAKLIEKGDLKGIDSFNEKDIQRGLAMALEADSTTLGTLYGIMLGLELRMSLRNLSAETGMEWNNSLVYKGFYQGVYSTVPDALPTPLAEEQINRILRPYFDTPGR